MGIASRGAFGLRALHHKIMKHLSDNIITGPHPGPPFLKTRESGKSGTRLLSGRSVGEEFNKRKSLQNDHNFDTVKNTSFLYVSIKEGHKTKASRERPCER
jgi:hypothetical protein